MIQFYDLYEKLKKIKIKIPKDIFYIATYANNICLADMLAHVSGLTKIFISNIDNMHSINISNSKGNGADEFDLYLANTGRFIVYNDKISDFEIVTDDFNYLGSVLMDEAVRDLIIDQYNEMQRKEKFFLQFINKQIEQWFHSGKFKDVCVKLQEDINHIATLFIHIENCSFIKSNLKKTSVEHWDNLSESDIFLSLSNKTLDQMTYTEKLLVVALTCLCKMGDENNYEEINGINLSPSILFDLIFNKYLSFSPETDINEFLSLINRGLETVCEDIGEELIKRNREVFIYRRINGIIFNKKQYINKRDVEKEKLLIPEEIKQFADIIGVNDVNEENLIMKLLCKIHDLESEKVSVRTRFTNLNVDISWIEYLLYLISKAAKRLLNCDFAFLSGLKDITILTKIKKAEDILVIKPEDMFCVIDDWSQHWCAELTHVMQTNRWNFLGGNFRHESVEKIDRYYRTPLNLPDISYNNIFHHDGHDRLNVQSVIRMAAPISADEELTFNGIQYKALYDIRGFRTTNRNFTIQELKNGMAILNLMDLIFKNIIKLYTEQNKLIKIEKYSPIFYEQILDSNK